MGTVADDTPLRTARWSPRRIASSIGRLAALFTLWVVLPFATVWRITTYADRPLMWALGLFVPIPFLTWLLVRRWRFRVTLSLLSVLVAAWSIWGALHGAPGFARLDAFADKEVPTPPGGVFIGEVKQGQEPPCLAGGWCTAPVVNRYYVVEDADAALQALSADLDGRDGWSRAEGASVPTWDQGAFDLSMWEAPEADLVLLPPTPDIPTGSAVIVLHVGGQYD